MRTQSTKHLVISLSIVIIILLGAHYLIFMFIKNSDKEVSILNSEVSLLQGQVDEFARYNTEDLENLYKSVVSHFIPRSDFVGFIESIEKEAKSQKIAVVIGSVGVEQRSDDTADDKEIIRIRLETNGSWADTMRFVGYIEHLPYKINIQNLGLSTISPTIERVEQITAGDTKVFGSQSMWRGQLEITTLKFK